MAEESARLRIPYIAASQAQKHVTHNEAMTLLDTLVQLSVLDKDLTAPPGSPAEGDCYIVATSATGAWTGWDNRIVRFIDGEWRSYLPGAGSGEGWLAYVQDEAALYIFNGSAWAAYGGGGGGVSDGDKGDITVSGSGTVWTVDADAITFGKMQNISTDRLVGRDTAASGDPEELTVGGGIEFTGAGGIQRSALTGDVSASAGSNATTIANNAVTFAKMQTVATDSLLGRDTTGTGNVENITLNATLSMTGAGALQRAALTGDVTAAAGSNATTIANDAVSYAKMQNVSATARIIGRKTATAGDPEECTLSEILDFVGSAAQGDILYRGASAWTRLGAGTSGHFLQTQGAGANPQWAAGGGGGFTAATQAEQEAASSTTVGVTPGRQHFHPSAAKAWAKISVSGGTPNLDAGYNIASISDDATGVVTLTYTTSFSSANYAVGLASECSTAGSITSATNVEIRVQNGGYASGSVTLRAHNTSGTTANTDPPSYGFIAFGDFA
jgi:hypothetical protein